MKYLDHYKYCRSGQPKNNKSADPPIIPSSTAGKGGASFAGMSENLQYVFR